MCQHALRGVLSWIGRGLLSLRYRVEVRGLDAIRRRGTRGVLFLPSHVALVDPAILSVLLDRGFHPRALADEYQATRPIIGWLVRVFGARLLPNMERSGLSVIDATRRALDASVVGLRAGECLLFYPAGRLRRQSREQLRAASGADVLLKAVPDARIVLVRQTGLWGSSFSLAFNGRMPDAMATALRGLGYLLLNGVFFMPRRRVLVEFEERADFPRGESRMAINRTLEAFYNASAPKNTYVPYVFWEKGGTRTLPEPEILQAGSDAVEAAAVPEGTRRVVVEQIGRVTGRSRVQLTDRLAQDLGLDSLAAADLAAWVEREFGFPVGTPESLVTVGDVVLAAAGRGVSAIESDLRGASASWLAARPDERLALASGETVTDVFLNQAARGPGRLVLADHASGEVSYRRLVLGVLLLVPAIRALPGPYVGIMLPASVAAGLVYLAGLFAGKTPVMINWTTGSRNLAHSLDLLGVARVITATALLAKLETLGLDRAQQAGRFLLLENIRARVTRRQTLVALVRSHVDWRSLRRVKPPPVAVVLFTSGSESLPKAVPLTHANILANIGDVLDAVRLDARDVLIGMLPPFHSFGICVTTILPLCTGFRCVFHPNPTEAAMLARLTAAYRVTVLVGTPTFLSGIVRAARGDELSSLRLAVTGAERCPDSVYLALRDRCRTATILEGYGITEGSPIVSIVRPDHVVPGSIGTLLRSVEGTVVDLETDRPVARGQTGMLLVRGASIFSGYLNYRGDSPFVERDGTLWYRTGDLVRQDEQGVLFFEGRLTRFVKLGGEMISLPAIEAVLLPHFGAETDHGPSIAVEAIGAADSPEIVLFSVTPTDRERVNQFVRAAGLSALYNVREVIHVDSIPVLGTGKTDHRALKERRAAAVRVAEAG